MTLPKINYFSLAANSAPRRLAYLTWGEPANPPVLCMHGLSRNAHDFDFLAQALEKDFFVICPDMAGRGNSDWLADPDSYHFGTYLADTLALLAYLKLETVRWVGTSMGGILGMMAIAAKPELVRALVLNDIGSTISAIGLKRIYAKVEQTKGMLTEAELDASIAERIRPFFAEESEGFRHLLRHSKQQQPDGSWRYAADPNILVPAAKATENFTKIEDIDLSAAWQAVTCPVLLLRGEHSDLLTRATAKAMQAQRQHVELAEFRGMGHAPSLTEPDQISIVVNWLKRH